METGAGERTEGERDACGIDSDAATAAASLGSANIVGSEGGSPANTSPRRYVGVGTGNAPGSRTTQFQPKHPGNPAGKPGAGALGPSTLLQDMRHVYQFPGRRDRTHGQRHCRRWLTKDAKSFLLKLAELEKDAAAWRQ